MSSLIGSTVQLKSGGPLMTVLHMYEDSPHVVTCQWFKPDGECKEMSFDLAVLKLCGVYEPTPLTERIVSHVLLNNGCGLKALLELGPNSEAVQSEVSKLVMRGTLVMLRNGHVCPG